MVRYVYCYHIICPLFWHLIFSFLDSALIDEVKENRIGTQIYWDAYQTLSLANRVAVASTNIPAIVITFIICGVALIAWDVSNISLVAMELNLFNYQKDNNLALQGLYNWNPTALDTINQNVYKQNVEMRKDLINLGEWTYYSIIDHTTCLTNYIINGLSGSNVTSCEVPLLPSNPTPIAPSNVELVKTNTSIYDRISSIEKQMKSSHEEIINNQENMEKQVKTIAASIGKKVKAKCSKKPDDEIFNWILTKLLLMTMMNWTRESLK